MRGCPVVGDGRPHRQQTCLLGRSMRIAVALNAKAAPTNNGTDPPVGNTLLDCACLAVGVCFSFRQHHGVSVPAGQGQRRIGSFT